MKSGLLLVLTILLATSSASATVWIVLAGNNFFAPPDLVIAQGDTVVWSNIEGTHNVVEDSQPPVFSSGEPAPAPWQYEFVFDVPLGTYDYRCELHAPEMVGTVTVEEYTYAPEIEFDEYRSVPEGATVGHGLQISLVAADGNPALIGFAISIDDTFGWCEWSEYSVFLIADTTLGLFPEGTTIISNESLTTGEHTIYARARDWRTVSPTISRALTVADGFRPTMDPHVTGTYGDKPFYTDGSAYHDDNVEAEIAFRATHGHYVPINAYRYRGSSGVWSDWFSECRVQLAGLAPGEHTFWFTARDVAGAHSDTVEFTLCLVEQILTDSIIIVDETRDGSGGPGSPNDEQVDNFYQAMVGSHPHRQIDYATHQIGGVSYLSPFDLQNVGLVIYHADDKANFHINDTRVVLAEYMDRGGRVIFSGWDLLIPFGFAGADSASYGETPEFSAGERFAYNYLRLHYALRSSGTHPRATTGLSGIGEFPDVAIDPEKVPSSWNGALDKCWVFEEREDCIAIGGLTVSNPEENPLAGRTTAHYCIQDFRVAVFGIPLYFCFEDEAQALFDELLPIMLEGLSSSPKHAVWIDDYTLHQNFPNPFNAATQIAYELPKAGNATLRVFDVLGREVATLVDGHVDAGSHRVMFDGSGLASGVYFYRLEAGDFVTAKKMMLLK
jgi:plastocyanin